MRHALETASWNWASDAARKIGDDSVPDLLHQLRTGQLVVDD